MSQLANTIQTLITEHGINAVRAAVLQLTACRCAHCGWKWIPRGVDAPKMCPRCKNPKWSAREERHED